MTENIFAFFLKGVDGLLDAICPSVLLFGLLFPVKVFDSVKELLFDFLYLIEAKLANKQPGNCMFFATDIIKKLEECSRFILNEHFFVADGLILR